MAEIEETRMERAAERRLVRDETPIERADRNLAEMIAELRVALPGVQVLFAFLLVVPFSARFDQVTPLQEKVYFGTLMCTGLATALLVTPSMYHRILFRRDEKEHLVAVSNRLTIVGLTLLAIAMCGAIVLITDFVFGALTTVIATSAVAITFLVLWFGMPLRRLGQLRRETTLRRM